MIGKILFLLLSVCLICTGCKSIDTLKAPKPGTNVKVSMIFNVGGRGDNSFNDMAYVGLERAMQDFGNKVTVKYFEPSNRGNNLEMLLRLQGQSKVNLVIGVGFMFANPVKKVAQEFPDTRFAIIDGSIPDINPESNITCFQFREQEGSFLMGAAAALKSNSGKIGFIGGMLNPVIERFEVGYIAGAKYINPQIVIFSDYIGATPEAFVNPDKGNELSFNQYLQGADIVYHASGASGLGVIEVAESQRKLVIGVDSDQALISTPEQRPYILTSMIKRVDNAVYNAIKLAVNKELKGGYKEYGLIEGGIDYAKNEYNKNMLADIINKLEETKANIINGNIQVPVSKKDI